MKLNKGPLGRFWVPVSSFSQVIILIQTYFNSLTQISQEFSTHMPPTALEYFTYIYLRFKQHVYTLRIQVCPKKRIDPTILLWGWDWDHQTYSREGYGSLGIGKYSSAMEQYGIYGT